MSDSEGPWLDGVRKECAEMAVACGEGGTHATNHTGPLAASQ